ncbi:hypothetical protein ACS0TY_016222 [Phlomoides rotata]
MELKHMQLQILHHRRLLNSYSGDDSEFDSNMVIILTFLLCALLFVIGLNVFARCGLIPLLRRSSPPEQPATPGMKKRELKQLPVMVYGSGPGVSMYECPICLGEFLDGERIRVLPKCSHGFHVGCIDTWLVSNGSCPNCRVSLVEPPPSSGGALPHRVAVDIWSQ